MYHSNLITIILALSLPAAHSLSDFYRLTQYANLVTRKAQQSIGSDCDSNSGSTCVSLDKVSIRTCPLSPIHLYLTCPPQVSVEYVYTNIPSLSPIKFLGNRVLDRMDPAIGNNTLTKGDGDPAMAAAAEPEFHNVCTACPYPTPITELYYVIN